MAFKFEITRHIATVKTTDTQWTREVNIVKWNDGPARYDIRDWAPDKSKMSKGITLDADDALAIAKILLDDIEGGKE